MALTMNYLLTHTWLKYIACAFCLMFAINIESSGQYLCFDRSDKIPVIGKEITFCEGKSIRITPKLCVPISGKVAFRWTYLPDTYVSTTNTTITITFEGPWEITATTLAGVVYKDTINFTYSKSTLFEIITNPLPLKCEGVPLTLKATKNSLFTGYKWFTSADTSVLSLTDTLYDVRKDTTYIVEALDQNQCLVADTFQVIQSPFVPKVNIGPSDTTVCEGTMLELKNRLPDNFDHYWNTGETDASINVYQSGKYWLKVRNTFRCTATDTITVSVVPVPKFGPAKNFYSCYGSGVQIGVQLSVDPTLYQYEWTPNQNINNNKLPNPTVNPKTNTQYKVRLSTKAGCQDTSSVFVVINPKLLISTNTLDTAGCTGKSIALKSTASGGSPGTSPSSPYEFMWKPATGLNNTSSPDVLASPQTNTNYTLLVKDSKACYDSVKIQVNISEMAVKIKSSKIGEICMEDTIVFNQSILGGIPPFQFLWSSNHTLPKDSGTSSLIVKPQNPGIFTLKLSLKDQSACAVSDSFSIAVNALPMLAKISSLKKICVGDTSIFPLQASGGSGKGYTFPWYPKNEAIRNSGTDAPVLVGKSQNVGSRNFVVRVIDSKSCMSKTDTLNLQTVPDYQVNFGNTDTLACQGSTILLAPIELFNKGLQFSWTKNSDPNPISMDSIFTISEPGKYTLGIKNKSTGCASYGMKNVDFILPPTNPAISALNEVCSNAPLQLIGSAVGKDLSYEWSVIGSGSISNKEIDTTSYFPNAGDEQDVTIKLAVKNNCGQEVTQKIVSLLPLPIIHITSFPTEAFVDSTIKFNSNSQENILVSWNFGDGSENLTGLETMHVYKVEDTYKIFANAVNSKGCISKDSLKVVVIQGVKVKELFIPTVFSPASSDKDNNALKVFGKNISPEDFTFRVYNKWGDLIYHTDNLAEAKDLGWNGNLLNAGQPVGVGLYTYTVKGKFMDGTPIEKAGSATLLK